MPASDLQHKLRVSAAVMYHPLGGKVRLFAACGGPHAVACTNIRYGQACLPHFFLCKVTPGNAAAP